jgi:hypothetical protein
VDFTNSEFTVLTVFTCTVNPFFKIGYKIGIQFYFSPYSNSFLSTIC